MMPSYGQKYQHRQEVVTVPQVGESICDIRKENILVSDSNNSTNPTLYEALKKELKVGQIF